MNSTEVSYGFGQLGSLYGNSTNDVYPPEGKVFVAIQCLVACTFDTLKDERAGVVECVGNPASHDAQVADINTNEGSGGQVATSAAIPAGTTIYGRWTQFKTASDAALIAYIGE